MTVARRSRSTSITFPGEPRAITRAAWAGSGSSISIRPFAIPAMRERNIGQVNAEIRPGHGLFRPNYESRCTISDPKIVARVTPHFWAIPFVSWARDLKLGAQMGALDCFFGERYRPLS